jgi:hypothetical protein
VSKSNKIVWGVFKGGWMLVFFPLAVSAELVDVVQLHDLQLDRRP